MTRNDQRVAIITGGSRGIGAGLVAGYRGRGWAVVANALTTKPSQDPDVLTLEGDIAKPRHRRPDHRGSTGAVRPHRHPGQQRRRVRFQAVHRLHRRGLRPGRRGEPHRVLLADPAGHRRDGDAIRRPPGQHLGHLRRGRELACALGPGRADQGRPGRGHPVAGRRVRLPRHPGQRRLPGIIQTPVHPPESYDGLGGRLPPLGRVGQVSNVVDGIVFLESSPYITGEILHIDGGQIAGR